VPSTDRLHFYGVCSTRHEYSDISVMSFDAARVQKELVEIDRDKTSGVSVEIMGDNLAHLTGFVKGALDRPGNPPT
jgi:hypothetical protein